MEIGETVYFTKRSQWRRWLKKNHNKKKEIWFINPKSGSGKPSLSYNDAVEEALCFGWIDSIVKTLDEVSTVQRFSPRRPKTPYSQTNIERLREMVRKRRVIKPVRVGLKDILEKEFVYPEDIMKKIRVNKNAWENFLKFSEPYKRIRIAFIDSARYRPEEFNKRLENFIKKTALNRKYGYGGVEKYF